VRETPQVVENVDPSDLPSVWRAALRRLNEHGLSLQAMLSHARFREIVDDCAVLEYSSHYETFAKRLDQNGKKDLVRQELSRLLDRPVGLRVEVVQGEAPPKIESPSQSPGVVKLTPELRAKLAEDPLIKTVLAEFGGEIVRLEDEHV
jgi:hypothetical protein